MINQEQWILMKNQLAEGVDNDKKENMYEVFDLILDQIEDFDKDYLKITLPIARSVYPNLSETVEPKDFVDRFFKKIKFEIISDTVDKPVENNDDRDVEAELMVSIASIIAKEFEKG